MEQASCCWCTKFLCWQEMNVFPLSAANPCRCFFLLTICMQLSMWINGDWRVAESGWCKVINQHNECRWAQCRWSPQSGLCHPAGSLWFPSLLLTVWQHVSTMLSLRPVNSATHFSHFFFLSPRHFHTIWKRKVLVQFLFKSTVWIWMWHAKPELSVKHRNGSVFCFMEGRCHPRNCAAQENWQRLKKNTTTSVRAINAGKWASGHIVN